MEAHFQVWQRKTRSFVITIYPEMKQMLHFACDSQIEIDGDAVDIEFGDLAEPEDKIETVVEMITQLYIVLPQMTEEETTTSLAIPERTEQKHGANWLADTI